MRSFQHRTWQIWPEGWYGKSLLPLVPALRRKRSKTVFGDPGQFQHASSFLTDVPVTRDASVSSVAFTTLLCTRRM